MLKISFHCIYLLLLTALVCCDADYVFNQEANGWLKLQRIPAPWHEAELRCHYEGAVLASPINVQLANALHKVMSESVGEVDYRIYLGTHDFYAKGDFFSIEGVPLSDMHIKWESGGLRADVVARSDCLTMYRYDTGYSMQLSTCSDPLPYICYKKLQHEETADSVCGTSDKKYVLNEHTGSCYKLHEEHQTWSRAFYICAAEGGYLVILNSEEEAGFVRNMFPSRPSPNIWERMFIGMRAWDNNRAWISIHGEALENLFHFWAPNQPDNHRGIQNCGTLLRNGTLDDERCDATAMFVCEKDPKTSRFVLPKIVDASN